MAVGLVAGIAVYLAGLVATFLGPGLRGRVVGLTGMAGGAAVAIAFAPPNPSWPTAVTVALTLVPLVAVAMWLRRRLEHEAGARAVTLDDDPR